MSCAAAHYALLVVTRSVSTLQQPLRSATRQRREVVRNVAARVCARGPGRLRVALDGRTASGKTSLGHEIAEAIEAEGRPAFRASLDDFKKPWSERHRYDRESAEGFYRNAYDYEAVRRLLLEPAAPQASGRLVLCYIDPLTHLRHDDLVVDAPPDAVLIVDGMFSLRAELADLWDMTIWVDVPTDISFSRGTRRDRFWAREDAERLHRERYHPAEEIYLREADPIARADLVIDNADFTAPVLRVVARD